MFFLYFLPNVKHQFLKPEML